MQVQSISSNNYNNHYSPNFGIMTITKKGQQLLDNLWGNAPEYMNKIEGLKKGLANTKYFDLEVDELGDKFWMFILKKEKNPEYRSCEAPLYVFKEPKKNKLDVFGTDILDCGDNVWYPLEFATDKDAQAAFNTLNTFKNTEKGLGDLPPIMQIKWAVDSVKILEKALKYMENPKVEKVVTETPNAAEIATSIETKVKLPFKQRLKNAWLALKG